MSYAHTGYCFARFDIKMVFKGITYIPCHIYINIDIQETQMIEGTSLRHWFIKICQLLLLFYRVLTSFYSHINEITVSLLCKEVS